MKNRPPPISGAYGAKMGKKGRPPEWRFTATGGFGEVWVWAEKKGLSRVPIHILCRKGKRPNFRIVLPGGVSAPDAYQRAGLSACRRIWPLIQPISGDNPGSLVWPPIQLPLWVANDPYKPADLVEELHQLQLVELPKVQP